MVPTPGSVSPAVKAQLKARLAAKSNKLRLASSGKVSGGSPKLHAAAPSAAAKKRASTLSKSPSSARPSSAPLPAAASNSSNDADEKEAPRPDAATSSQEEPRASAGSRTTTTTNDSDSDKPIPTSSSDDDNAVDSGRADGAQNAAVAAAASRQRQRVTRERDDGDDSSDTSDEGEHEEGDGDDNAATSSGGWRTIGLHQASTAVLPRRIVFVRARHPDVVPRPIRMRHLNREADAALNATADLDAMREDGGAHAATLAEPEANDDDDPLRQPAEVQLSKAGAVPPLRWSAVRGPGAGLNNLGATCFLNAVVQCLSYMPPLQQFLVTVEAAPVSGASRLTAGGGRASSFDALHVWAETARQMFGLGSGAGAGGPGKPVVSKRPSAISPSALVRNMHLLSASLTRGEQHDANELALTLIDAAQISMLRRSGVANVSATGKCQLSLAAQQTTMLMRLVGGVTRSQLQWSKTAEVASLKKKAKDAKAKGDGTAAASFQSALREIENAQADGSSFRSRSFQPFTMMHVPVECNTLRGCLKASCVGTSIDGYSTPRKGSVEVAQTTRVHVLPPCLIIHLKRFEYDGMRLRKLPKQVAYTSDLDMREFMTEEALAAGAAAAPYGYSYQLTGVVVHLGSTLRSGHYVACVRAANGLWYLCDDEEVRQMPLDAVLQQQAYMLFYTSTGVAAATAAADAAAANRKKAALATPLGAASAAAASADMGVEVDPSLIAAAAAAAAAANAAATDEAAVESKKLKKLKKQKALETAAAAKFAAGAQIPAGESDDEEDQPIDAAADAAGDAATRAMRSALDKPADSAAPTTPAAAADAAAATPVVSAASELLRRAQEKQQQRRAGLGLADPTEAATAGGAGGPMASMGLRGRDALRSLRLAREGDHVQQQLQRHPSQGRFGVNQRDRVWNEALDAGHQKKLRRDMVHGRDAGLFASDQGPNRFQQTAERKRDMGADFDRERQQRDEARAAQFQQSQFQRGGRGGGGGRGGFGRGGGGGGGGFERGGGFGGRGGGGGFSGGYAGAGMRRPRE
jgi:hypothetical protein